MAKCKQNTQRRGLLVFTITQQLPKTKLQMVYIYGFAENTLISM